MKPHSACGIITNILEVYLPVTVLLLRGGSHTADQFFLVLFSFLYIVILFIIKVGWRMELLVDCFSSKLKGLIQTSLLLKTPRKKSFIFLMSGIR
jgi:hypothetical protein